MSHNTLHVKVIKFHVLYVSHKLHILTSSRRRVQSNSIVELWQHQFIVFSGIANRILRARFSNKINRSARRQVLATKILLIFFYSNDSTGFCSRQASTNLNCDKSAKTSPRVELFPWNNVMERSKSSSLPPKRMNLNFPTIVVQDSELKR